MCLVGHLALLNFNYARLTSDVNLQPLKLNARHPGCQADAHFLLIMVTLFLYVLVNTQ